LCKQQAADTYKNILRELKKQYEFLIKELDSYQMPTKDLESIKSAYSLSDKNLEVLEEEASKMGANVNSE